MISKINDNQWIIPIFLNIPIFRFQDQKKYTWLSFGLRKFHAMGNIEDCNQRRFPGIRQVILFQ